MAAITVTQITRAGVALAAGAAASGGGDTMVNDGKTFLKVVNGGGSPITVTVDIPTERRVSPAGADPTFAVSNGATVIAGPFPTNVFNNSSGQVAVTYSAVTSVTVIGYKL